MSILKRFMLALSYGPELEALLKEKREELMRKEVEENRSRLHLCFTHRQEPLRSQYDQKNCDYCRLLELLKEPRQ